jgi:hypothetical protein
MAILSLSYLGCSPIVVGITQLTQEEATRMYEAMLFLPALDNILYNSQRQGRISFYMLASAHLSKRSLGQPIELLLGHLFAGRTTAKRQR